MLLDGARRTTTRFIPLVRLTFVCSHVAAARVLLVRARHGALIGLQQMTRGISAATRVARINRGATRGQSHGLRRSAIVLQGTEQRVGVVQVTSAIEVAGAITAQVESMGGYGAAAVSPAGLLATMLFWRTVVEPEELKTPPPTSAPFPLKVVLLIVSGAPL
jgi:hypothetical protein